MVRGGEVDLHAGELLDLAKAVELGAVVGGDGLEEVGPTVDQLEKSLVGGRNGALCELADQNAAGSSFDEADDAVFASCADDRIHLPVTDLSAELDRRWALGDMALAGSGSARFIGAVAVAVPRPLSEGAGELTTAAIVEPHPLVDALLASELNRLSA